MNKTKNNDTQYRRGIVLGLTFAELLILLLFIVMLVLGKTLKDGSDDNKKQYSETQLSEMRLLASLLKSNDEESYNKITKLLKEGKKEKAYQYLTGKTPISIKGAKHSFTERELIDMKSIISLIEKNDSESSKVIQKHLRDGDIEKAYQEIIESSSILKNATAEIKVKNNIIGDCRAQNKHLVNIKNIGGRGGDFPSCWRENGDGAIQYLFNIELTDSGIMVHDNIILSRENEKQLLPLKGFKFDSPMQPAEFINAGQKLKKLSDDNSCRFFVNISDKTSPSSKEHYKKLRNSVESIFYKKDI